MTRQERLNVLRQNPQISVLIIGGGINGVGLYRELALQGIDVLLVEKSDFCAGTSAASTRVIHGGLRYLENGEFRLVRESLRERNRLLHNAPHYVKPLPTTIPIFNWTSGLFFAAAKFLGLSDKPSDRGAALIKVGLTLYDLFAGTQRSLPAHRFRSRHAALQDRPDLNPGIVATATYYDARIAYPERLCLELVLDAEAAAPDAHAFNYMSAQGAAGEMVELRDTVSGESFTVKPRLVVNATGAWIDFTNRALQHPTQFIGGTKGSHLVVDHPDLHEATQGEMLYFANADGRICIFYPFYDRVIVGSTDIPVDDPETALCEDDEVDYLLESVRQVFPDIVLDRSHIVYRFCGVRPLPRSQAATTGQISRDHRCEVIQGTNFPIYALIGGKWTTFRAFAEQVTDQILPVLGRSRMADSHNLAIGGGQDYAARQAWLAAMQSQWPPERLEVLLDRYGMRAALVEQDDRLLEHHAGYSRGEIEFIAAHERVVHLEDVILRRTLMAMLGQLNHDLLHELAAVIAPVLGWSQADQRAEIERTLALLERVHGVSPSPTLR